MLFGDEPRFSRNSIDVKGEVLRFGKSVETESHVGPGTYFSTELDEIRNGWKKRSFSRKQPMTPPEGKNKYDQPTPGPGHYSGNVLYSFGTNKSFRPQSAEPAAYNLSTTPRNVGPGMVVRNGVIYYSSDHYTNRNIGPGSYDVPSDKLIKKSFNVRANSPARNSMDGVKDIRHSRSGLLNNLAFPSSLQNNLSKNKSISSPRSVTGESVHSISSKSRSSSAGLVSKRGFLYPPNNSKKSLK
eukprot:gene16697-22839_t